MKQLLFLLFFIPLSIKNIYAQSKLDIFAVGNFGMSKAVFTSGKGTISPSFSGGIPSFSGGIGSHLIYNFSNTIAIAFLPVLQAKGYENTQYKVRATYLELPINIEYSMGLRALMGFDKFEKNGKKPFFFGAGVYAGYAIAGKYIDKYQIGDPSTKIKFGEASTDQRSKTDFGLNFTLGMLIPAFKSVMRFGLQKQVGLKNVIPKNRQANDGEMQLKNFNFFIAYNLGNVLKRKGYND